MYGLVIGAGEESIFAIKQAKELGMTVIGFDGDHTARGLKYVDEAYVLDIRDAEQIYNVLDIKGYSNKRMVVIPVPIGRYLISAGRLNDHYGLTGVSFNTANSLTDKFLFHSILQNKGLRKCKSILIKQGTLPDTIVDYPFIVKPRYGAGSRSVRQISNQTEWNSFVYNAPYNEDYVLEEAIQGTEYGLDGMVIDGRFYCVLLRKKEITPPPIRQCVGYYSVRREENEQLYKSVEKLMIHIIDVIGLDNGILHADIIDTTDDPFVIEMSARPSGHYLHNIFTPIVTGVNMIEQFLKYVDTGIVNMNCKDYLRDKYLIHYFDISDKDIKKIPSKEYIFNKYPIEQYVCHLKTGHVNMIEDGHSIMNRGYFILKGNSEQELAQNAQSIIREFI